MILIENVSTGERQFVESAEGYDPLDWQVVEENATPTPDLRWGRAANQWVHRELTDVETNAGSIAADPRLQALLNAKPDQIAAWMNANVTTLAQARQVLTALALAVRYLYKTRG